MEDLAKEARAACFGTLACRSDESRRTIFRFLDTMAEGSECVFDINLRLHYYDVTVIEQGLGRATMLKLNDEEIEVMARLFQLQGDREAQCRELLRRWPKLHTVILTCGVEGSYVFTETETSFQPTPRVEVADTVGAGDAFAACYVTQYLDGQPVGEAHRRAVTASAYVCTQPGAMPVMPKSICLHGCKHLQKGATLNRKSCPLLRMHTCRDPKDVIPRLAAQSPLSITAGLRP